MPLILALSTDNKRTHAGTLHGGDSDIIIRLGKDAMGVQKQLSAKFDHVSVWCEEFKIDFGNAALVCPEA